jgi:predicted Zn-dependent protease
VVTDELIELADHDEEVLAVLAHEIGHVVHKHGLRSVLQSSAVALLLTAVTGDIGSASGFAAAMPIILLETNYSRKFEREADQYAFGYMKAYDFDTKHFATILEKITGDDSDDSESVFAYLSTHPSTSDRTRRFTEASHADD